MFCNFLWYFSIKNHSEILNKTLTQPFSSFEVELINLEYTQFEEWRQSTTLTIRVRIMPKVLSVNFVFEKV